MTPDEHQRERMRAWVAFRCNFGGAMWQQAMDEFDKRFPAPAAAPVDLGAIHAQPRVTCPAPVMPMAVDSYTGSVRGEGCGFADA